MISLVNIIRVAVVTIMLAGSFVVPVTVSAYTYKDFLYLSKKAEAGDPVAMRKVGVYYYKGSSGSRDFNQALAWFKKSAEAGDAESMRYVGILYFNGEGVPRDYNAAKYWYQKAVDAGDSKAPKYLADINEIIASQSTVQNATQRAAGSQNAGGSTVAKINEPRSTGATRTKSSSSTLQQRALTPDQQKFQKAKSKAEQGDVSEMFNVGLYYDNGKGVKRDYSEAKKWYLRAAERGHGGAANNIGDFYEDGNGVSKDLNKARYWYKKAVELGGTSKAGTNLERVVAELNRRSYGQSNAESDYNEGKALRRKYKLSEALPLLTRAAEWGHKKAMFELAILYAVKAKGAEYNNLIAKWLISSAEAGNVKSYKYAGMLYENGFGCTNNYFKAQMWYQKGMFSNDETERLLCEGCLRRLQNGWGNPFHRYMIVPTTPNSGSYNYSSGQSLNSDSRKYETREVPCTSCNATGLIPRESSVCSMFSEKCYNIDCKVCGRRHCQHISSHQHCSSCDGTGKRKQIKINGNWCNDYRN